MPKKERINPNVFRVAIFGSSRIKKGDPIYELVFELAKMIGEAGIDIVTGGGPGLMEAANAGHNAGDVGKTALSFGLNIKLPREQKANKHLEVKKEFDSFSERLDKFIELSNVVVVAPGGIGTLLELLYTWQLTQVEKICEVPIILLGNHWDGLMEWINSTVLKKGFMSRKDLNPVFITATAGETMDIISKVYKDSAEVEHVCRKFSTYKRK